MAVRYFNLRQYRCSCVRPDEFLPGFFIFITIFSTHRNSIFNMVMLGPVAITGVTRAAVSVENRLRISCMMQLKWRGGFLLALVLDNLSKLLYSILYMETTKQGSKLDYQRDEHRVHLIVYHLIWCPKRHKPLLIGLVFDSGQC